MAFKYIHIHQVNRDLVCRACCNIRIFIQVIIKKAWMRSLKIRIFYPKENIFKFLFRLHWCQLFHSDKTQCYCLDFAISQQEMSVSKKSVNLFLECFIQEIHFCWLPESTESTCLTSLILSQWFKTHKWWITRHLQQSELIHHQPLASAHQLWACKQLGCISIGDLNCSRHFLCCPLALYPHLVLEFHLR